MTPLIRLDGLRKAFAGTAALRHLDLAAGSGEYTVLLGPSGSGKTTALRLIAGLERPDAGRVEISGRDVTRLPPRERDVGMVFQTLALFPHLTARMNLAFGLRPRGAGAGESVAETARMLGLADLLERYPGELSGGERQRVALGRALLRRAAVLLLDEPLSSLDAPLRASLRGELRAIARRRGMATIHVTHDQAEAMAMASRIVVLRQGAVEQSGAPDEVHRAPRTVFVARFIGDHGMNIVPARIGVEDGFPAAALAGAPLRIREGLARELPRGGSALVGLRPGSLRVRPAGAGRIRGRVEALEPTGGGSLVSVSAAHEGGSISLWALAAAGEALREGAEVSLDLDERELHFFDPVTEERLG